MGFPMTPELQDYIRIGITVVFLGIFSYEAITGQPINPIVEKYLILLIGFYFGIDRLGDFAGKFITRQKAIRDYNREERAKKHVT